MYEIGNEEVQAIKNIISKRKLFRYLDNSECDLFEKNYAKYLTVKHATLASSGTAALTAALIGLKIGPGDEVLVPAHTYMATAMSVLSAGAIPIIVDIDETLTIDPKALELELEKIRVENYTLNNKLKILSSEKENYEKRYTP